MKKVAISVWNSRIAPVFDVARHVQVVDVESGLASREVLRVFTSELPVQKAMSLVYWGVDTLLCGAISRQMRELIQSYDIQVVPFLSGGLDEIIQAISHGRFNEKPFLMPGCSKRRKPCLGEGRSGPKGAGCLKGGGGRPFGARRRNRGGQVHALGGKIGAVGPDVVRLRDE